MSEPRTRADLDKLSYPVHCHVCPGGWSADQVGLPRDTDQHPRYASRLIGNATFGGLWHCPEHANPAVPDARRKIGGAPVAECGCPLGDWTDEPPTDSQIMRWDNQRAARDRAIAELGEGVT